MGKMWVFMMNKGQGLKVLNIAKKGRNREAV